MMSAFPSIGRLTVVLGLCAAAVPAVWAHAHPGAHAVPEAAQASAAQGEVAGVVVRAPWARATVPGQQAGGLFVQLQARTAARLVAVESPHAARGEIHEMRVENDVMRMRPIEALPLPAGELVELRPGGYHLMLMGLKAPLQAGTEVPVTLWIEDAQGQRHALSLQVPVRALNSGAHGAGGHMHH